ncbi:MAG: type II toxin-antitoxin system CcdA family antitoxin [Burkholderiales bacterium]|nr:type II toxin-antitoxin system CcdA family antitoxin [Burkholderiales bacterium]
MCEDAAKPWEGRPSAPEHRDGGPWASPPAGVGVNSEAADGSKPADVRERANRWLAESSGAFLSSNAFVAAHGLPLAKYRQF